MRTKLFVCFLLIACFVAACVVWSDRLHADFWPIDRSYVGPNLLANLIWIVPSFAAGLLTGLHVRKKNVAHQKWVARHVAAQHRAVTGQEPESHPHFDL